MARNFICPQTDSPCARGECTRVYCANQSDADAKQGAHEFEEKRERIGRAVRRMLAGLSPQGRKYVIGRLPPQQQERLKKLFPKGF